jgi:hypothetical protein
VIRIFGKEAEYDEIDQRPAKEKQEKSLSIGRCFGAGRQEIMR